MKQYRIVEETLSGKPFWMIEFRLKLWFISLGWSFIERWNTPESAKQRLADLEAATQ